MQRLNTIFQKFLQLQSTVTLIVMSFSAQIFFLKKSWFKFPQQIFFSTRNITTREKFKKVQKVDYNSVMANNSDRLGSRDIWDWRTFFGANFRTFDLFPRFWGAPTVSRYPLELASFFECFCYLQYSWCLGTWCQVSNKFP